MITKQEYLEAKKIVEDFEREQEEIKLLLQKETITIKIERCLYPSGNLPYIPYAKDMRLNFKNRGKEFYTITDLKKFYNIKKVTTLDEVGWAISPKGKRVEWKKMEAEIPISFLVESEYYELNKEV